jgi:hypothetical protein
MTGARTRSDARALRALLNKQSEQVAEGALQTSGQVSADHLDELNRLARLVEMREDATRPGRNRWAVPLVAVVTVAAMSVLLFARVSSTEIELELKVSELSFVVPELRILTNALNVSGLRVSGLRAIELPGDGADSSGAGHAASISLAPDRVGRRTGTVSVDPISVPGGARVWLRKVDGPRWYGMNIRGATSGLAVSANGPVRLVIPQVVNEARDFSFPRRINLAADSEQVSLEFAMEEAAEQHRTFQSPVPADSLLLYRIDRFQQGDQALVRRVPTIQSGTLYLESLNGEARPLREGEGLNLAWSSGEMRQLRLDDDGVLLRFHGVVSGMTTGSGDVRRSLMPTWLESLRAQHGLWLLWGTTAYVVGFFVTVLGWWRRPA